MVTTVKVDTKADIEALKSIVPICSEVKVEDRGLWYIVQVTGGMGVAELLLKHLGSRIKAMSYKGRVFD